MKFPSRTTLEDIATGIDSTEYSLQEHLNALSSSKFEAEEFAL